MAQSLSLLPKEQGLVKIHSKTGIIKVEIYTPNTLLYVLNGQEVQDAELNTSRRAQL